MSETPNISVIREVELRPMPWKNGLGTTNEIQIYPPTALFPTDKFLWRLSSATISGSNDFSKFPGYDRILVVWKGPGLELNQSHKIQKMEPLQPHYFAGEETIHCKLLDPAQSVVDYGVIYRRGEVFASLSVSSEHALILSPGATHYITCINGSCKLENSELLVSPGETLVISVPSNCSTTTLSLGSSPGNFQYFHAKVKLI